jgi:hypothetical protein
MFKDFIKNEKVAYLIAVALILITVFIFFNGLFKGEVIATNDVGTSDLLYATYPVQALYGESLKHGEFMQWNPFIWSGFPVFAEGPYGFLYPIDLVVWYLFEPVTAMNIAIILNPIIMGIGMYLFARQLTQSPWAAILPAVATTVCGPMLVHARHYSASTVMALLPWLFFAIELYLRNKAKMIYCSLFYGAILGLMILAGHPQYTFICFFITFIYLILKLLIKSKNDIPVSVKPANKVKYVLYFLSITGVVALIIGFPQLKETIELVKFSQRSTENLSDAFTGLGSLPWDGFQTFFSPYFLGNAGDGSFKLPDVYLFWEYFHYAGAITFILALVAIFRGWKKSNSVKSLVILGIFFFLMSLGSNFPIYKIFSIFPFLKSFRFQVRWLLGTEISVIALSGFGLLEISSIISQYKHRVDKNLSKQKSVKQRKETKLTKPGISLKPSFAIIISLAVLTEIYVVAGRQVVTSTPELMLSSSSFIEKIKSKNDGGREFSLGSSEFFRSVYSNKKGWEGDRTPYGLAVKLLPPHLPSLFHVPVIYGYTALVPNYIYEVWGDATHEGIIHNTASVNSNGMFQPKDSFLKLCNMWRVKYFTSIWKMPEPFVKVWDSLGVYNYELPGEYPKSWVVSRVNKISGYTIQKESQKLLDNNFNPLEEAITTQDIPTLPPNSKNGSAEIISSDNHSIKIKANEPGLVVLSDTWYTKWKAKVDGVDADIYRVNSMMRGVISPRVGSIIEMNYDTGYIFLFTMISYITLFFSIGYSMWGIRKSSKKLSQ